MGNLKLRVNGDGRSSNDGKKKKSSKRCINLILVRFPDENKKMKEIWYKKKSF